jgi:two-component system response regulator BaeR
MMQTILIVEDEKKLANILSDYLKRDGFKTEMIENGIEVVPWVKTNNPDLILLDLMLPNVNGKDICKEIRTFSKVPIIMVTAMIDEVDRLIGLELEADDYICKPFSPKEVVARVKTVLRRSDPGYINTDPLKGFVVNTENYSIILDGKKLDLTPVEFRILSMFINYPGRVYNRDQILNIIFEDGRIVLDRTVDTHIKNLRKKLYAIIPDQEYIRSVYGIGYSFEIS